MPKSVGVNLCGEKTREAQTHPRVHDKPFNIFAYFTARGLMNIFNIVPGLLGEAADGQSVVEIFGDDINEFFFAPVGGEAAKPITKY